MAEVINITGDLRARFQRLEREHVDLRGKVEGDPQLRVFLAQLASATQGTKEPDWSKAPNAGDTIQDGTIPWKNAGFRPQCLHHGGTGVN